MSALVAVLSRNDMPVSEATLKAMMAACPERAVDGRDLWTGAGIGLGHQHFWITPEELGERQPFVSEPSRCAIVADVRLDNREELTARLDIRGHTAQELTDAELILQAYLRWGVECVDRFLGDFAFAIWDAQAGHLFCTRDPLGARSIAYYEDSHIVVVATDVEAILEHPWVTPSINETKIADYLASVYHYPDEGYYEGIQYCPAGHCLLFTSTGSRSWRYWELRSGLPVRYRDDREYVEHFDALLADAVRCRLRTAGPVGISLSGGLDSPSLAAIAAELLPESPARQERLHSFSYVFDELAECDEREFIGPVVDKLGLDATYVPSDGRWTLRDLSNWTVDRARIFADPYILLPEGIMEAAQAAGCKLLLAGHYGDSLFTGARFWAVDMLRDRPMALSRIVHSCGAQIRWRSDILDAGLRHTVPISLRDAYRRRKPFEEARWRDVLDPGFAAETAIAERKQDPERHLRADKGSRLWSRLRSLRINLTTEGLVEVQKYYNRHGLELSNPYLDRRLAEFVVNVPAYLLGHPGGNRWLLRSAAQKHLPKAVADRRTKTSFESLMDKGVYREAASIRMLMQEPLVVDRGYVRAEWAARQFTDGTSWRSSPQRTEAWLCICLELWLRQVSERGLKLVQ